VIDGAHRLLTTFELGRVGLLPPGFTIDVLWG
jgi:hypothetical protein